MNETTPEQPLLTVSGISKKIEDVYVVRQVGFEQKPAWRIAIAGETGSGKSTLLKIIAGLAHPDEGKVYFEGRRVMGPNYQLVPGEAGIAYLSQHYELRNHYRMEELLSYANEIGERAEEVYRICEIDHLMKRNTFQLSGGEKQRIALARLLVGAPRLLLLDEPFSNLDLIHKTTLKKVISDIGTKLGITCILTSHDPLDTLSWADEIMVMRHGIVVQQATPLELYRQPVDEYVAGLFGTYSVNPVALLNKYFPLAGTVKTQVMLRPEQLQLSRQAAPSSVEVTIANIVFWGAYYELELHSGDMVLLARSLHNEFVKGDKAYVSLNSTELCYW